MSNEQAAHPMDKPLTTAQSLLVQLTISDGKEGKTHLALTADEVADLERILQGHDPMVEALEPFAKLSGIVGRKYEWSPECALYSRITKAGPAVVTWGDLHRAADALKQAKGE